MIKYIYLFIFGALISNTVFAESVTVEMLNKQDNRSMVFSPEIVRINLNETVFWKATDKGHNVEFIKKGGVPEGVDKFKSKVGKDTEYTFSVPGIYAYWCTPHKTMGMIGFIIVDNNFSNFDSIKKIKYMGRSKKIAKNLIEQLEQ